MLEYEALTERIIQAAISVHRQLGPGFIESVYEAALSIELSKRELRFDRQRCLSIYYDGSDFVLRRFFPAFLLSLFFYPEAVVSQLSAALSTRSSHRSYAFSNSSFRCISRAFASAISFPSFL